VIHFKSLRAASTFIRISAVASFAISASAAQTPDANAIIRSVDAAVAARYDNVLAFTDTEHYAVYRGSDQTHPAAEMTVTDNYKKGVGKTYTVLSQSGSSLIQRFGLKPLLDNEQTINLPGNVEKSWFISANYNMTLRPGGPVQLNGCTCYVLDITAKRKASNTINGSMWVDARDGSLMQIDGVATDSASILSGPAHMMRQYANISGYSMAMHARAESDSSLLGRTVVTIDYSNYQLQIKPAK
jgi:outer membrane lipoprotein-sorting protein